jgi:hypothetical protein
MWSQRSKQCAGRDLTSEVLSRSVTFLALFPDQRRVWDIFTSRLPDFPTIVELLSNLDKLANNAVFTTFKFEQICSRRRTLTDVGPLGIPFTTFGNATALRVGAC